MKVLKIILIIIGKIKDKMSESFVRLIKHMLGLGGY